MVEWFGTLVGPILGLLEKSPLFRDRVTKHRVHYELAQLVFWQDGMRATLATIASGHGARSDLDELARRLRSTQDKTDTAGTYLANRRVKIAQLWGPAIALQVDLIVHRKMGPGQIRQRIREFVERREVSQSEAQRALDEIDQFTTLMHELKA